MPQALPVGRAGASGKAWGKSLLEVMSTGGAGTRGVHRWCLRKNKECGGSSVKREESPIWRLGILGRSQAREGKDPCCAKALLYFAHSLSVIIPSSWRCP